MRIHIPRVATGIASMILALLGLVLVLQSQRPAVREAVRVPVFTSVDPVGQIITWEVSFDWPARAESGRTESLLVRLVPTEAGDLAGDVPALRIDELPPWSVEGRLDLPGVTTNPAGVIYAQADALEGAGFGWQIIPTQAGSHDGTLWIYVNTTANRQAVLARPVTVEVGKILFLRYASARRLGALALASGIVLGISLMWGRSRSVDNK